MSDIRQPREVHYGARAEEGTVWYYDIDRDRYVRMFKMQERWQTQGTVWYVIADHPHRLTNFKQGWSAHRKHEAARMFFSLVREVYHSYNPEEETPC